MQFTLALVCCTATWYSLHAQESGGSGFLGVSKRQVTIQEIKDSVRLALGKQLMSGNSTSDAHSTFATIEASLASTYRAMHKNDEGGISSSSLVYLVRSYFAKEHGWHIHGLGSHISNVTVSEMHNASILEEMAPAIVQNLIDAQSANHVFFLKDVVAMVATLEYLVISESARILEDIYEQQGVNEAASIEESTLLELLVVYSVTFELPTNPARVQRIVRKVFNQNFQQELFLTPMQDIVKNFGFTRGQQNPFAKDYGFGDALSMVTAYHKSYGKRQREECTLMKEELMRRDASGMGRIPLHRFHAESDAQSSVFAFGEGKEYLREIGALDESDPQKPKVIIPNYVQGPWNCLARSGYYAICCVNECEAIMNSIEAHFEAPTVAPQPMLEMVGNLSSETVEAPRQLPHGLVRKLQDIAKQHNGEVPIYGRQFAQWIHFAFPNECPYPSLQTDYIKKEMWMPGRNVKAASSEEKLALQREAEALLSSNQTSDEDPDEVYEVLWDDMEVLHLSEDRKRSGARAGLHYVMFVAVAISACAYLASVVQQARHVINPTSSEFKCSV